LACTTLGADKSGGPHELNQLKESIVRVRWKMQRRPCRQTALDFPVLEFIQRLNCSVFRFVYMV
jgi:hypothetical protein